MRAREHAREGRSLISWGASTGTRGTRDRSAWAIAPREISGRDGPTSPDSVPDGRYPTSKKQTFANVLFSRLSRSARAQVFREIALCPRNTAFRAGPIRPTRYFGFRLVATTGAIIRHQPKGPGADRGRLVPHQGPKLCSSDLSRVVFYRSLEKPAGRAPAKRTVVPNLRSRRTKNTWYNCGPYSTAPW